MSAFTLESYAYKIKRAMYELACDNQSIQAVRDLVTLAHNPGFKLPVRSHLRLARTGLIDVSSKPGFMVYCPDDIRDALNIESDQVWLGNPSIHLGTTETLRIPRVYDEATKQWVTPPIPLPQASEGHAR